MLMYIPTIHIAIGQRYPLSLYSQMISAWDFVGKHTYYSDLSPPIPAHEVTCHDIYPSNISVLR